MDNWIDVNDRLPVMSFQYLDERFSQDVLVLNSDDLMSVGYLRNGAWELASEERTEMENVTHWQPLPDPPRRK